MEVLQAVSGAETSSRHIPVMQEEVVALLRPQVGNRLFDGTLGGGGHALALLAAAGPNTFLFGMDQDAAALSLAARRLAPFAERCIFIHDNFSNASVALREKGWVGVDSALLDLGFSSLQIEDAERGFSFLRPGPLDMRMDSNQDLLAADLVNSSSEEELKKILREFGEEPAARPLARALVRARSQAPIQTTADLVRIIAQVTPRSFRSHLHPATRVFQALRIVVNQELAHLSKFLQEGYRVLRPGGRLAILSYHSLEDRLVKGAFRRWAATCLCPPQLQICACGWSPKVRLLTPKPLTPTAKEVAENPRARSARLRVVERLGQEGDLSC